MRKIGITGGIGSGKSTIAHYLEVIGYPIFYSDLVAKQLMENDPELQKELVLLFGSNAISTNGLNRPFIAEKLFNDNSLKQKLEAIIHPRVRSAFSDWAKLQATHLVFNEAAILFESGSYKYLDEVWLVVSPLELRVKRLSSRDGASLSQIEQRIQSQWTDEQKIPLADFIIFNDESHSILLQIDQRLTNL